MATRSTSPRRPQAEPAPAVGAEPASAAAGTPPPPLTAPAKASPKPRAGKVISAPKLAKIAKLTSPAGAPKATKPAKASKSVKTEKPAKSDKPAKAEKSDKSVKTDKLANRPVRDSFTMPAADFGLIVVLKNRALSAQRAAKKSELLRAGLHALAALDAAELVQALDALQPVPLGRPRQRR